MRKYAPPKIIVFSVGYNCSEKAINKNILSVKKQCSNREIEHIVIDDGLNGDIASKYPDVIFFKNDTRLGAGNLALISKYIKSPDDIIVLLNLNNWFADPYSLQTIVSYNDCGTWVTYGSYISSNATKKRAEWIERIPESTLKTKRHRMSAWRHSIPLSFRAYLWNNINMEYFKKPDGTWLQSCYDVPLFHMLLDMTPCKKIALLNEIIAVSNVEHNDALYEIEQTANDEHIKGFTPLCELDDGNPVSDCKFILLPIKITDRDIKKYGGKL